MAINAAFRSAGQFRYRPWSICIAVGGQWTAASGHFRGRHLSILELPLMLLAVWGMPLPYRRNEQLSTGVVDNSPPPPKAAMQPG